MAPTRCVPSRWPAASPCTPSTSTSSPPSLPSIIKDIGGLEYYAWNTTLFVVTSIVGSALSAQLIQAWGPKAAYLLAVAVFSAGSVVCALAPSMPWMLAGRSIQGLGGGVLFALSYALIRIVFDAALWSRAMALVSGMWG